MNLYFTQHRRYQLHPSVFVAQGAIIVGDVTIGAESSVWFNAVVRGDTEPITVGQQTNLQDGVVVHVDPDFPVIIGDYVTIGHRAIIHGAKIARNVLIGMGSTVLNGVQIGENSIVGANALLTQNKIFPPNVLILGSPAKVVRELTAEEITEIHNSAQRYVARSRAFMQSSR